MTQILGWAFAALILFVAGLGGVLALVLRQLKAQKAEVARLDAEVARKTQALAEVQTVLREQAGRTQAISAGTTAEKVGKSVEILAGIARERKK